MCYDIETEKLRVTEIMFSNSVDFRRKFPGVRIDIRVGIS